MSWRVSGCAKDVQDHSRAAGLRDGLEESTEWESPASALHSRLHCCHPTWKPESRKEIWTNTELAASAQKSIVAKISKHQFLRFLVLLSVLEISTRAFEPFRLLMVEHPMGAPPLECALGYSSPPARKSMSTSSKFQKRMWLD